MQLGHVELFLLLLAPRLSPRFTESHFALVTSSLAFNKVVKLYQTCLMSYD